MRLLLLAWLAGTALAAWADTAPPGAGAAIYGAGRLPSGQALQGEMRSGVVAEGQAVACVNCHRRSGLGAVEGRIVVPPLTARHLFRPFHFDGGEHGEMMLMPAVAAGHIEVPVPPADRRAYTDATLARAIRQGVDPEGRPLNGLMPRFRLDDADMASLIAYLKQLSRRPSPGVGGDTLQFATVITPDADPVKARAMLEVLEQFFGAGNVFVHGESPPLQPLAGGGYQMSLRWQLHVWQLTGPAETWQAQLQERLRKEPVFAVLSGIGGRDWAPVHRFCEAARIPCLFPNVDDPVAASGDFYSLYFSQGVGLEARLMAEWLEASATAKEERKPQVRRVVQVYRRGDIGEDGAAKLADVLAGRGIASVARPLPADADAARLRARLEPLAAGDALVLWLRPGDLKSLPARAPASRVIVSGILGGLEQAPLPPAWKHASVMAYPFNLPQLRRAMMDFPLGWFHFKNIPVVAERVQTDTYLACLIMTRVLGPMREDFVREHLMERLETMLDANVVNGYYPRLGLAPGQRFASKGGYVVRFADGEGPPIVADSGWMSP